MKIVLLWVRAFFLSKRKVVSSFNVLRFRVPWMIEKMRPRSRRPDPIKSNYRQTYTSPVVDLCHFSLNARRSDCVVTRPCFLQVLSKWRRTPTENTSHGNDFSSLCVSLLLLNETLNLVPTAAKRGIFIHFFLEWSFKFYFTVQKKNQEQLRNWLLLYLFFLPTTVY